MNGQTNYDMKLKKSLTYVICRYCENYENCLFTCDKLKIFQRVLEE